MTPLTAGLLGRVVKIIRFGSNLHPPLGAINILVAFHMFISC